MIERQETTKFLICSRYTLLAKMYATLHYHYCWIKDKYLKKNTQPSIVQDHFHIFIHNQYFQKFIKTQS